MKRLIAYVVGAIVATLVVGSISEQRLVRYEDRESVIIFALVVGLVSAYIKPVLKILTLPLTCLTFGLFALVLNAVLWGVAARLTPGIEATVWGAVAGSAITSIASGIVFSILDEN
ncbi:MAG: phage holin family protein [Chloroflexota bacterium]|nr:phage holin family protein [Chloroflexota bacterium]MDQ3513611.1 phage holin family protein [Chloroflexota bacterium]